MSLISQNDYKRNSERGLKVIGGMNTVIHCHHYNSRLQRTIEGNSKIDGKRIMRESSAVVYHNLLNQLKKEKETENSFALAKDLYKFLGFGTLDFSEINNGLVVAKDSHYVEGWKCGAVKVKGKVCRMTEGYIEGAIKAILNKDASVTELECMNEESGCNGCHFKVEYLDKPKYNFELKKFDGFSFKENRSSPEAASNINKQVIVDTVLGMPLEGNNEGLIPAFNVYLAHTPQDYYNLICINFIKEMTKINMADIAKEMLVEDAENCALNTFGGIWDSEEWKALIAPMVQDEKDNMFGLIAVANALGWGKINIVEHTPYESLKIESYNGYEAFGFIELENYTSSPQCFMLRGIAAGLMGLIYQKGDLEDRGGKYTSEETCCLTKKDPTCSFDVKL